VAGDPGIGISVTVLAINLVASWMRLISDPRNAAVRPQMRALRKSAPARLEEAASP
jgi:peptide/nickel transport system permease protein